jgi:Tfp pilus assembly protein PilV
MAGIINHRVNGSTLIEVITALVIISMIFVFATLTYINIQRADTSARSLRYQMMIDNVYANLQMKKEGRACNKGIRI